MNNHCFKWVIAGALAFGVSNLAANDHDLHDGRFYVTGKLGVAKFDRDRLTDSAGPIYGVGVGRFFTPRLSLDLELDRAHTKFERGVLPPGDSRSYRLTGAGLVGRFHFTDGDVRPYAALGAGRQRHQHSLDRGNSWYGSLGVGVWSRINDYVNNRFELGYRYDRDRSNSLPNQRSYADWSLMVHFQFMLGAPPRAPAPPPEPAPAPTPRPAEPPPPPPPPAPPPEPEIIFVFDSAVTFEFDSAQLRPGARAELNRAARMLNEDESVRRVEVAGHTCDIGAASYNQGLSERRAQAVYDYLVNEGGVNRNRLVTRGYGEGRPAVPNTSEENRSQNRRVELVVLERRD